MSHGASLTEPFQLIIRQPKLIRAISRFMSTWRIFTAYRGRKQRRRKPCAALLLWCTTSADVHHTLGLSLVRQKRTYEAVEAPKLGSTLNPNSAHYVCMYAVALNSKGKPEQAIMVLQGGA